MVKSGGALFVAALILVGVVDCLELHENRSPYESGSHIWRLNNGFWPFSRKSLFPISRRTDFIEDFTSGPPIERDREPLELDVISGSINNPEDTEAEIETDGKPEIYRPPEVYRPPEESIHSPDTFFNQFFGNPFLNTFGFNGFGGARRTPWWKGQNVCTERQEDIENWDANESAEKKSTQSIHFGIHLSLNSCVERSHKHVCTTIVNDQGRKKTLKITRQCCHGFARKANADPYTPCEKFELRSISETGEKLGGKEFMAIAKKNGLEELLASNITIFMPNDASFSEFSEQMLESNLVVLPLQRKRRAASNDISSITNKDLVLNHIISDWINIEDIENEQLLVTDYNNLTIRMNIFPAPPNDRSYEYPYRYTANCAPLVKVNQVAENGIIHMVDGVLTPVSMSLIEIINSRSDMAVLQTVLQKTNLAKMLANDNRHFTLFAPTDAAFEKLTPQFRRTIKEGNGCALNILKNHILDMTFCSAAVVDDAKTGAINSLGLKINLERAQNNDTSARDMELADLTGDKQILINGEATIVEKDIMATNGVIHVIDTVLTTESGMPFLSMLEKRNLTVFKRLIEANDIETEFDTITNASFFIPTDKAFEDSYWKMKLDEEPDSLKGEQELKDFLEYHIAQPMTKTCDLSEKMIDTKAGIPLRVNLYSTHSVFNNVMNRATANCARLVHFDDDTCGSVLHQVDRILTPPKSNLLEALEANKHYSMFLKLVKESNLTHLLNDPKQSLTILVPNNDIFRELDEFSEDLERRPKQLENFVKLHILDDVLCCAGIVQTEWPFVRLVKTINDYELKIGRDRRPKVQNAGITKCDIITKNGVILEVNDVINIRKQKPQEIPLSTFLNL